MKRQNYVIVGLGVLAGLILVVWGMFAVGENMPRGVTSLSQEAYRLHMIILWVCVAIGVIVFGAMFISIALHRKSRGVQPAQFTHSNKAEALWTVIPAIILVAMAIPATNALLSMEDTSNAELDVKVTGYQWKWEYEYLDSGVSFISSLDRNSDVTRQLNSGIDPASVPNYLLNVDNPLVLPTDTRIRFLITSGDVIHAWWVPEFGWKRDAIPGLINEAWVEIQEPGTYRGQCAELCGKDHGFMPVVVEAVPPAEFEQWLAQQQEPDTEQLAAHKPSDAATAD